MYVSMKTTHLREAQTVSYIRKCYTHHATACILKMQCKANPIWSVARVAYAALSSTDAAAIVAAKALFKEFFDHESCDAYREDHPQLRYNYYSSAS